MTISETDLMAHCTVQSTVFHDLVLQLQDITLIFPTDEKDAEVKQSYELQGHFSIGYQFFKEIN